MGTNSQRQEEVGMSGGLHRLGHGWDGGVCGERWPLGKSWATKGLDRKSIIPNLRKK